MYKRVWKIECERKDLRGTSGVECAGQSPMCGSNSVMDAKKAKESEGDN